jgi:Uma2 family endonuclease
MAMPASRAEWTVDMLDALPDDGSRYEIIDGELFMTPSPAYPHQAVVGALFARLRAYLRPSPLARAVISPSDIRKPDRDRNHVEPDIFAIRLRNGVVPPFPFGLSDLLLAVEVVSPSTGAYDYQTKRQLYLGNGVPEYWIVDPAAHTLTRFRSLSDPAELLTRRLAWHPEGMPAPFIVELPEFFEDALG